MAEVTDKPCPNCSENVILSLKDEAGYAKYWFGCRKCGWESQTFRGPKRPESEIDEIGYNKHVDRFRQEALEEAAEVEL